jgi:hypothetical protein
VLGGERNTLRWMPCSPKGASMLRRDMMGLIASMVSMMRMLGCFPLYRTSSSSQSASTRWHHMHPMLMSVEGEYHLSDLPAVR